MTRRHLMGLFLASLLWAPSSVVAHEDFKVIGVVSAYDAPLLQVQGPDGRQTVVRLEPRTPILEGKRPVPASTLKAGLGVEVDAWGDDESDLVALEIRIVPPPPVATP